MQASACCDNRLTVERSAVTHLTPPPDTKVTIEPRYASLPNIMKAKKKPIEKFQPIDLGVDVTPILEIVRITEPQKRVGGTKVSPFTLTTALRLNPALKVESVDELVARLKAAGITAV